MNIDRLLGGCAEALRSNLLHNASMASGELFHSNMLAFLFEQTRPQDPAHAPDLLNAFVKFAGAPFPRVDRAADLGKPRATSEALRRAAVRKLPERALGAIDEAYTRNLAVGSGESDYDFVRREVSYFDLLVDLNASEQTKVDCRVRPKHGQIPLDERTMEDVCFPCKAPRRRLVIELKVKSIATKRQLQSYSHRLDSLLNAEDQGHLLLLTLFPAPAVKATERLTIRSFRDYQLWLREVETVVSAAGVTWVPEYRRYLKLLTVVSRCVWRLVQQAHAAETPYTALDQRLGPLRRCRLFASYLKLRASFMSAELEDLFESSVVGSLIGHGDAWDESARPFVDVYAHYSNGTSGFGAVVRHVGPQADVIESVGVQFQGDDYRPYVSWDWKNSLGKLRRISPSDVERSGGENQVEQRRHELHCLAEIAGPSATPRAFDHRWRGYGRPYGDLSARALLKQIRSDVQLAMAELGVVPFVR